MICPICKRRFEGEQLVCPHDDTPLVPEDGGPATRAETAKLLSDETAATVRQTPVDGLRGLTAPVTAPMFAVGAGGPADESDVRLPAGRRVGEYEVTGVLGTGGMSTVYSGVHPVIGKRVAIKVMLSQYACDANRVARFVREARAVNQVDSDHIVDIFALGTLADGRNYCVMELVHRADGQTYDHQRHIRRVFGGKRHAITGCFRSYVRCKPEHWRARWSMDVDATGRLRSVTFKAGKIPPRKLVECVARKLKSANWGATPNGQRGVFDLYISVSR